MAYLPVSATVAGHHVTCLKRNLEAEDDDEGFAYFDFESENTLAVATGTLLWDASVVLIDLLNSPTPVTPQGHTLRQLVCGRRVIELGAGIGLAGICCACAGAHMLITDLPSIVDGILKRNIEANSMPQAQQQQHQDTNNSTANPRGCCAHQGNGDAQLNSASTTINDPDHKDGNMAEAETLGSVAVNSSSSSRSWPGAHSCGQGSVMSIAVDFCKPLSEQVSHGCDARDAEVVLAADIVWLKELITPLANTISGILRGTIQNAGQCQGDPGGQAANSQPYIKCASEVNGSQQSSEELQFGKQDVFQKLALLAFGERATATSNLFINLDEVMSAFEQQGCHAEAVVRKVVEKAPGESMPVVLLRITLKD